MQGAATMTVSLTPAVLQGRKACGARYARLPRQPPCDVAPKPTRYPAGPVKRETARIRINRRSPCKGRQKNGALPSAMRQA